MGSEKPLPIKLSLQPADLVKYNITKVNVRILKTSIPCLVLAEHVSRLTFSQGLLVTFSASTVPECSCVCAFPLVAVGELHDGAFQYRQGC